MKLTSPGRLVRFLRSLVLNPTNDWLLKVEASVISSSNRTSDVRLWQERHDFQFPWLISPENGASEKTLIAASHDAAAC